MQHLNRHCCKVTWFSLILNVILVVQHVILVPHQVRDKLQRDRSA